MTDAATDFAARLAAVRERVGAACKRSGRSADEVRILPIGKRHSPGRILEAADAGLAVIGENRVQEARQKIAQCPGWLEWHLVGHLQSNKAAAAAELFTMIHSLDSAAIAGRVNRACEALGKTMPVCLEVNVSGESSKFGLAPEDVPAVLESCAGLMNLDVVGLMTVPPFSPEPEDARSVFARLRDYRDRWRRQSGFPLDELSMGMSGDFEVAVEEGATWLRLGTVLFGTR
jgi:pyridoxal phosphate enzyme (YggS family)